MNKVVPNADEAIRDMQGATMWITHDPEDWKEYPHKVE